MQIYFVIKKKDIIRKNTSIIIGYWNLYDRSNIFSILIIYINIILYNPNPNPNPNQTQ